MKLFKHLYLYCFILFLKNFYNSLGEVETDIYPYVKRLYDGSYIVLSSQKISFVDDTFTNTLKTHTLSSNQYAAQAQISSTIVSQFKSGNKYIVAIIGQSVYVFSTNATFLAGSEFTDVIKNKDYPNPLIVDNNIQDNNYLFYIIRTSMKNTTVDNCETNCRYIVINKMKFVPSGTSSGSLGFVLPCFVEISDDQGYTTFIACDLMIKEGQEYMACFYGKPKELYCKVYNFQCSLEQYKSYVGDNEADYSGKLFKVSVLPTTREKALICMINQNKFLCISYDITSNTFGEYNTPIETNSCSNNYIDSIIMEYFYETERFLVGCLGTSNSFYLAEYNNDMSYLSYDTYYSDTYLVRLNIILPKGQTQYRLFAKVGETTMLDSSLSLTINKLHDYPLNGKYGTLNCEIYYNYEHNACLTDVPEGYYPNSTEDKTIDKCYDSCKTCSTGGTAINHNCLSCNESGTEYYNLGNCVVQSACTNGYFTDDSDSIKKCKCINNSKCLLCNANDKCISCNNDDDYYAKKSEQNNNPIDCYKNLQGYYVNNNYYEPCYKTCQTCNQSGNINNHNCLTCKSEYSLKLKDNNDHENCYLSCSDYYYIDESNAFHCVTGGCPTNYKLIYSTTTNQCVRNCPSDKYEYKDICYSACPQNTSPTNSNLCEIICNAPYYYNYYRNECISDIPEGYYNDDPTGRTIDKCYERCQTCNEGGTSTKNNCLTCKDEYPYYYYNKNCYTSGECNNGVIDSPDKKCKCMEENKCLECDLTSLALNDRLCLSCNTGASYYPKQGDDTSSHHNCYNDETISDGYYLNKNTHQYEQCYSSCNKCTTLGNEDDHKCTECKSGYTKYITNDNIENCYQTCNHYLYFDNDGFHCTDDDNCPSEYKLITSTNRCIDNCWNDIFKNYYFEYNNQCVNECPNNTHISDHLCLDDLIICSSPKYYNYERSECIDSIPTGHYCNSTTDRTIDKCYDKCKTCNQRGTRTQNNCLTCKTGYYKMKDDALNNCYNNLERYYLNIDIYEPCFSTCRTCDELGDLTDNKCNECLPAYTFKNDFENDNNCYEKCTFYYYYDNYRHHYCTNDKKCPNSFNKIIPEKKKMH